jgi:hypothetical protein
LRAHYTIVYCSEVVQKQIIALPETLAARYIVRTRWLATAHSARCYYLSHD